MLFTQEQINEIRKRLALGGSKDPQLPIADLPLTGRETIAIVQNGENKRVAIDEFYEEFSQYIDGSERVDFFNVSRYAQRVDDAEESVPLTLAEAVSVCPDDVKRGGQIITFVDEDGRWSVWQYKGVSSTGWSNLDTNWIKLDSNDNGGIIFTISAESVPVGETENVYLHFETKDGGVASSVKLYLNGSLYRTYTNIENFDLHVDVAEETEFVLEVSQYGYNYEETRNILVSYPAWIGSGQSYNDAMIDSNKIQITDSVDGSYNVTFDSTGYLVILIPRSVTLGSITMSGFDVPMKAAVPVVIEGAEYYSYVSSNSYIAGTHTFVLGTYKGSEKDLVTSMQQDIAGLQTLVGEQEEVNQEQAENISNLQSDVTELQDEGLNSPDNEDIVLVDKKYKFANKSYDELNFSGKGRMYLRKHIVNITEGNVTTRANLLIQSMISNVNTMYIIQYDYILNGSTINLPAGCILKFEGGSISGGTLVGNNTVIVSDSLGNDMSDVSLSGTWKTLSTVATSGSYNDLSDKPTIPSTVLELTAASGSERPTLTPSDAGKIFFDTNLALPIWWTGSTWVKADGTDPDEVNE